MKHNHVTELIDLLHTYALAIWPILSPQKTGKTIDEQVLFVADYPNMEYLDRLAHYESPLKAILSIADYGMISKKGVQFGERRSYVTIRVIFELITADPMLREELGGSLLDWLEKNQGLLKGTKSNWTVKEITSAGVTAAPDKLFARHYYLWLSEFS